MTKNSTTKERIERILPFLEERVNKRIEEFEKFLDSSLDDFVGNLVKVSSSQEIETEKEKLEELKEFLEFIYQEHLNQYLK